MKKYFFLLFVNFLFFTDFAFSQVYFHGDTAGIVNGRIISKSEYVDLFFSLGQKHKSEAQSPKDFSLEVHNETWDQLVVKTIVDDSIEKRGIIVTDSEVHFVLLNDPPEFLRRSFTDSIGAFNMTEYLRALQDPKNDSIVRKIIISMKYELKKPKFQAMILADVTVTDDELWEYYKDRKGATRKNFAFKKKDLRAELQQKKEQMCIGKWVVSAKANAKIIDYRTFQ